MSNTRTLIDLLDELIDSGHGDDMVSDGADDWDLDSLRDAVAQEDMDNLDWVADVDDSGVAALVAIDPMTQRRYDHPPAYARRMMVDADPITTVEDLIDALNESVRRNQGREIPENYWDVVQQLDPALIDWTRADDTPVTGDVPLASGGQLVWLPDRRWWIREP